MTTVAGNKNSIGYISLGSLNDTVKAVKIDGTESTVENIKNNAYKVFRPFNIATKEDLSEPAQDFIRFILSSDGQKVVEDNGYIASSEKGPYSGSKPSGKIVVAGSSSVTPVMEKLKEAYLKLNTNAEIEIQISDLISKKPVAFVRKKAKDYGTCKIAEGASLKGKKVCVVEDVVTTGGQIIESVKEMRDSGAIIQMVVCVIERDKRGRENLEKQGLKLTPLFTIDELNET